MFLYSKERMLSSACDGVINIWELPTIVNELSLPKPVSRKYIQRSFFKYVLTCQFVHSVSYADVPHTIHFMENSSTFAVTCFDGYVNMKQFLLNFALTIQFNRNIYLHTNDAADSLKLKLCKRPTLTRPNDFVWGTSCDDSRLAHFLYAISESCVDDKERCHHIAFNIETGRPVYRFDISEQGEAIALNAKGQCHLYFTVALLLFVTYRRLSCYYYQCR